VPNNAAVQLTLTSQVAPQIAATANAYKQLSAEEKKAEQAATAYAAALSKVALADAKTATEEQRLAIQTANAAKAQTQAEAAALRLAQAQERAASGNSFASETAQAFTSQISAMVSPVTLAAAGIGALIGVANSFKEAFSFKAQLDQTTASIEVQLRGVRDSGQVFSQAARFADTYKLTQQETTEAIRASLPVIRQSQASTEDVLGTLARLRVLNPEQDFAGAARALAELKAGQVTSIVDRFNIGRSAANAMKKEIEGGGDAVLVLSKYLDSAGIGMDALKVGASGASGAMRNLAVAQEQLKIAQSEFAQGPGLILLSAQANLTRDAVKLLKGDVGGLNDALKDSGVSAINPLIGALTTYNTYVLNAGRGALQWAGVLSTSSPSVARLKDDTVGLTTATQQSAAALDADAKKKLDSQIATAQLSQQQAQLDADSQRAAQGLLGAGDQALLLAQKYGIAADQAQFLINQQQQLANKTALADQRVGERDPSSNLTAAETSKFADLARQGATAQAAEKKKADEKAAREAEQLQAARDNLALSRATTSAQKIAVLRRQQAATADPVEKLRLQAQIEQAQQSGAKAHTSELGKQLNLHESIYDSLNKQRDAQLDIEELTIRDRQQDRADAEKTRTAQRILASSTASADLKARAQDALALISVEDRKRAQAIAEKGATAGGAIIGGKVFQSAAGGPLPPGGAAGPLGALPPAGGQGGAAAAGGAGLTINLVVDGKTLASVSEPYIMDALVKAVRGARASAGA